MGSLPHSAASSVATFGLKDSANLRLSRSILTFPSGLRVKRQRRVASHASRTHILLFFVIFPPFFDLCVGSFAHLA